MINIFIPQRFENFFPLIFSIFIFVSYTPQVLADISLVQVNPEVWELSGKITKDDIKGVSKIVESTLSKNKTPFIRLNTPGGDMEAAIEIGRLLRKSRAIALTYSQGKCYSACVFVLAGAVRRQLTETVGIHRPYSTDINKKDYHQVQSESRRLAKLAKEFLEEMNVSPTLYDDMVNIPPERLEILSELQLKKYGVLEIDPIEEDLDNSTDSRKYGISKSELLYRKSRIDRICRKEFIYGENSGDFMKYSNCRIEVLTGKK